MVTSLNTTKEAQHELAGPHPTFERFSWRSGQRGSASLLNIFLGSFALAPDHEEDLAHFRGFNFPSGWEWSRGKGAREMTSLGKFS